MTIFNELQGVCLEVEPLRVGTQVGLVFDARLETRYIAGGHVDALREVYVNVDGDWSGG